MKKDHTIILQEVLMIIISCQKLEQKDTRCLLCHIDFLVSSELCLSAMPSFNSDI